LVFEYRGAILPQRIYGPQIEDGIRHFRAHLNPLPEFPALTHVQEAQCEPTHSLPLHIHETFEIAYVVCGRGEWRIENQRYPLKAGDLLLIQPGELHDGHADANQPYTTLIAGFDPAALPLSRTQQLNSDAEIVAAQRLATRKAQGILVWDAPLRDLSQAAEQVRALDEALGGQSRRVLPGAYGIEPIFRRLIDELDRTDSPVEDGRSSVERTLKVLMAQALLMEMMVFIARHQLGLNQPHSRHRAATPELRAWLEQRLDNPPALREMAAQAHLSPAHFAVAFKRETGLTPLEYLTNLRIEVASTRLRAERRVSITQIALDLGFSSPQYFGMVFQKLKGCTPSQWRGV
jgi:AraC-like DNA-binding protein